MSWGSTQAAKLPEQRQDHAQRTVRSVSLSSNSREAPDKSVTLRRQQREWLWSCENSDENSFITNSSEELGVHGWKGKVEGLKGSTFQDSTPWVENRGGAGISRAHPKQVSRRQEGRCVDSRHSYKCSLVGAFWSTCGIWPLDHRILGLFLPSCVCP